MSRLLVKNLPSYISDARLKEVFSQKNGPGGTLTDVKVAHKQDGTSRRFGFVGFKTEQEAKKAQEWFDRTYIDTTRISVQIAELGVKDAPAPRPNKRPRLDPSSKDEPPLATDKPKEATAPENGSDVKDKSSMYLDEFLKVMKPRTKKGPSWANDEVTAHPTLPLQGTTPDAQSNDVRLEKEPTETENDVDDIEWMKRRMTKSLLPEESERVFEQDEEDVIKPNESNLTEPTENIAPEVEVDSSRKATILETSRLFLRNMPFSCSESDLHGLFTRFGEIVQAHIILDSITKTSKGMAYVTFAKPASAVEAYEAMDKTSFQGRLLHILPAIDRGGIGATGKNENDADSKTPVKVDKAKKRKENAGREFNWSMLYMNSDAVASSIAERMNIKKSEIVNPEDEGDGMSPAVKLALAETHIIQETKTYLESEGLDLTVFSSLESGNSTIRKIRSDTCILVKNIPYGTSKEHIMQMFQPHGKLNRVLLPPAGTIAVVEFIHADEASRAFRAVAYRRIGSSIIYLEKAPMGIFKQTSDQSGGEKSTSTTGVVKPITIAEQEKDVEEADERIVPGSTLFVKNLSFSTTSERLSQIFRHLPEFAFARVQTKPDAKGPELPRLSMGYGFVGFKSAAAAKKAILSMQNFVLDGHSLHVKFAGRGVDEEDEEAGKGKVSTRTTKILVKNVPFEASKKDIRELFGAHGQLKSVRLPKKFDSRSRGFAFLDFVSRRDAENAYTALRHTHLLGRHLVLEWAQDEQHDVALLRLKAGVGYGGGSELPGQKRKFLMTGEDGGGEEEEE